MKQEYKDFLMSWVWGGLRAQVLERAEGKCEVCGVGGTLHIHHKTYKRAGGNETLDDLIALCPPCHKRVHALARGRAGVCRLGLWLALVQLRLETAKDIATGGAKWQVK